MTSLYSTFADHFPHDRDRPLLHTPGGQIFSYRDADTESARLAHFLLDQGLRAGDRVTVQAPKSPTIVWLYLACLRAGLVYHPLNDAYQDAELAYFLRDAQPRLAVCTSDRAETFRRLLTDQQCEVLTLDADGTGTLADASAGTPAEFRDADCADDATAVLLYSSGTTGQPKGAMLTHANLAANTTTLVAAWGFSEDDLLVHALPVYHAHGLFVALGCVLMSGSALRFLPKFEVDAVIGALADATVMMGIPTFYARLLASSEFNANSAPAMRLYISGSAPLAADTHRDFSRRTGHDILERYGMTETSMLSSNPLDGKRRPGSVGPALPGVAIRVVDEHDDPVAANQIGHVQVSGPNIFKGYWGMPDQTALEFTPDNYFRTGDLGTLGTDGYLTIVGRNKDMIISGGLNVYPKEIELAIDELDGVVESAVVGVPHADFGEGVVAVIVTENSRELAESDIITSLRRRLANFKVPKRVIFTDELPRNTMGKVQKNELRQRYASVFS